MPKSVALQAIKARCKDCIGESVHPPNRPVRCTDSACALFGYRTGHNFYNRRRKAPLPTTFKPSGGYRGAIRAYCQWCCNGSASEARKCGAVTCPLYPLRVRRQEAE